jgi:hypothetical protein
MKKILFLAFVFMISAVFFGCAGNVQLQTELPDTMILDKSPLRVALYIPDSTRNYTEATRLKDRCGFSSGEWANRYGEIFAEAVQGTLSQVFKEVKPVRRPVAEGNDVIIQAEFTELAYKRGCRPDPVAYIILNGNFRALDKNGAEIWRSNLTSRKVESPLEMRYTVEKVIPSAMATLVGEWTKELLGCSTDSKNVEQPNDQGQITSML